MEDEEDTRPYAMVYGITFQMQLVHGVKELIVMLVEVVLCTNVCPVDGC